MLMLASCSKHEDAASQDSLLAAPAQELPPVVPLVGDTSTGLLVDSFVVRQQPDMQVLKRFTPEQVVALYDAYRPLRVPSTTTAQVDSFLKAQKITEKELHSVLAEGDRLGWSGHRK